MKNDYTPETHLSKLNGLTVTVICRTPDLGPSARSTIKDHIEERLYSIFLKYVHCNT